MLQLLDLLFICVIRMEIQVKQVGSFDIYTVWKTKRDKQTWVEKRTNKDNKKIQTGEDTKECSL